jgi:ABC transport system ATP-binding/permease protein
LLLYTRLRGNSVQTQLFMNYLSAENLARNFQENWLFKGVNFGLLRGDKVALVGQNGSGKTSLLNILAGAIPPDEGSVSLRKGITVGYLSQNPELDERLTVLDTLFMTDNPGIAAIKRYEQALESEDTQALAEAMTDMDMHQAWDYESKIKQILGKLGIQYFDKLIGQLSGGQRKRVAMAKILIESPDLIILDEPTNHLDLDTIEWLENTLSAQQVTLLLVTHDRYFLDKVCNTIVELDNGKLYTYKGNYAYHLEKKAEREAVALAEVDKARNLYRRELEWMRRQPKARGTKAQYRVDSFYDLQDKANQRRDDSQVQLDIKMARQGSKIMELEGISKGYNGHTYIEPFTYTFQRKDRIGIVGKNGTGKSTFLKMLTGSLAPDAGKVVVGDTVVFGYYEQEDFPFRNDQRVIDVVKEVAEVLKTSSGESLSASQLLTRFLFPPAKQYTFVEKLSGGEKRRLQLLRVLIQNPNFLILDEPTNDLDIGTLNVLEEFLEQFGGTLVLVSHDRYFMDRLVNHLFVFDGKGYIRDFPGNYTDYRESPLAEDIWAEQTPAKAPTSGSAKPSTPEAAPAAAKRKLSFKEQRELEQLEKDMANLNIQKNQFTEQLTTGGDYEQIARWAQELDNINALLDDKEMRWLELSEMG